jgi:hypothetical protein
VTGSPCDTAKGHDGSPRIAGPVVPNRFLLRDPVVVPQWDGLGQPCIVRQASPKGETLAMTSGCCSSGRAGHMEPRHGAIGDLIARSWGNAVLGVRGREFGARSTGAAQPGGEVRPATSPRLPRVEPESRSSCAFDFEISTAIPLCSPADGEAG